RMHGGVGLTFFYVTHDQQEALAMSDRVAVMRYGRIEQLGDPVNIYDCPETEFVARFIGACNVIVARVRRVTASGIECDADGLASLVTRPAQGGDSYGEGERIALALRPEAISIRSGDRGCVPERNGTALEVRNVEFTGATLKVQGVSPGGDMLDVELGRRTLDDRPPPDPGDQIIAEWREPDLTVLRKSARNGDS
ncbi:MAG: TOBE domain-containing protein, partial [Boseongicola sp.]|nr:TOBE domain-containing protein [Boseongicola sp.]